MMKRPWVFRSALAHFAADDVAAALNAFRDAVRIVDEIGTHKFLLLDAVGGLPFLQFASVQGTDFAMARRLLEDLPLLEQAQAEFNAPRESATRRVCVRIRAFGPGTVEIDGRIIAPTDWPRSKARDLFFAIATAPGGLDRTELQLMLWPDLPEHRFSGHWRSAWFALRATVGQDLITHRASRYRLNGDTADIWCDVQEWEAGVDRARALSGPERAACFRKIVPLAEKTFLSAVSEPWADERRVLLEADLERCLECLAAWAESSGDLDEALHCANLLAKRDDGQESMHALILRCHIAAGEPSLAVRHFRNYERRARRRGMRPAGGLLRLYQEALQCSAATSHAC